jgi:uncharacterized membrane protein YkgB
MELRIGLRSGVHEWITEWMARCGIPLLRISLGIVFLWFGALKFFPGLSPAAQLATRTVSALSLGLVPPAISLPALACWESVIGLGFITGRFMRLTLGLLFLQMVGTALPLFFFPGETFIRFPYAATLEGQYIIKNIVLVSAAVVIGATLRGGGLVADPEVLRRARAARAEGRGARRPPPPEVER